MTLSEELRTMADELWETEDFGKPHNELVEQLRALADRLQGKVVVGATCTRNRQSFERDTERKATLDCGCQGYALERKEAFGANDGESIANLQAQLDAERGEG